MTCFVPKKSKILKLKNFIFFISSPKTIVINASDLGVDIKPRIEQIKVEEPPKRKAGIKVSSIAELVQKLKNEAKVI